MSSPEPRSELLVCARLSIARHAALDEALADRPPLTLDGSSTLSSMLDTRELARSSGAFALLLAPTTATKISQMLICPNSRLTRPTSQNHRKADLVPRYAPPIYFAPFGYSEMCVRVFARPHIFSLAASNLYSEPRIDPPVDTHCLAVHRDICVGKIVELNIQFIDTSRVQRRLEMGTNLISAPPPRFPISRLLDRSAAFSGFPSCAPRTWLLS
ncbi:hypothetical protein B0H14DRAFT_1578382 [Mycena olivaceomarginata]|nr:hypothetical protein B0H14DRAFT_1578382 [Mycena olivaceomarginata]